LMPSIIDFPSDPHQGGCMDLSNLMIKKFAHISTLDKL
jgi:hypothetical protein